MEPKLVIDLNKDKLTYVALPCVTVQETFADLTEVSQVPMVTLTSAQENIRINKEGWTYPHTSGRACDMTLLLEPSMKIV
ncbi:MAG: hypothetical protein NVSMB52_08280 [Chloroflexota bacterium]